MNKFCVFESTSDEKNTNFAYDQNAMAYMSYIMGVQISKKDMENVEKQLQSTKNKMPSTVLSFVKSYKKEKNEKYLSCTTFRYIVHYKKTKEVVGRLSVALADFGYTKEEIDKMSLDDIIDEIISR